MLAILNSLNARNLPIFEPILMILVSKFMVHRALSDKTYLLLGLLSPLTKIVQRVRFFCPDVAARDGSPRESSREKNRNLIV